MVAAVAPSSTAAMPTIATATSACSNADANESTTPRHQVSRWRRRRTRSPPCRGRGRRRGRCRSRTRGRAAPKPRCRRSWRRGSRRTGCLIELGLLDQDPADDAGRRRRRRRAGAARRTACPAPAQDRSTPPTSAAATAATAATSCKPSRAARSRRQGISPAILLANCAPRTATDRASVGRQLEQLRRQRGVHLLRLRDRRACSPPARRPA